ncbi:MAG TPA: hypothetical protein VET24_06495 [Actinomycetota bacterium]|nr:hypothetical protein [Actinomycetota bacterium]
MSEQEPAQSQGPQGQRVVLGRNTPDGMVRFQWTGAEPDGLDDTKFALACGAVWEGDDLVTYNLQHFKHNFQHWVDEFLEDSD